MGVETKIYLLCSIYHRAIREACSKSAMHNYTRLEANHKVCAVNVQRRDYGVAELLLAAQGCSSQYGSSDHRLQRLL